MKNYYLCGKKRENILMLEFKNTSVLTAGGNGSRPFSLVVNDGDLVCFCGKQGSGKSKLLRAILGLEPTANGFITFDGEIISFGSASYFRQFMAYIPQELPSGQLCVSELFGMIASLHANSRLVLEPAKMFEEWNLLGLDKSLYDKPLADIGKETLQLVMLSFLPMLDRKIVLIDDAVQNDAVSKFLAKLASAGTEIICTCRESRMRYDKIVNL